MTERNGRPGRRYDDTPQHNQSPVVTDEMMFRCLEARSAAMHKGPEAEVRAIIEAALPSGVRVTDDLADKLCQAITHSGALMYQEEIVAVQDVIRKTLSAIEPAQAPEGEIERHQLFGDFGVEYDDDHYVIRWLNDDGSMDSLSVFHSGSIVGVRTGADGEQLSRKFHFDDAIHATPSHAETVAPYAAALRMIRDAVGELFGPVSDLESEEAVLLRGPEPHHEAEAIIAGLQRVKERLEECDHLRIMAEMRVAELEKALKPFADDEAMCAVNSDYAAARAALHPEREG